MKKLIYSLIFILLIVLTGYASQVEGISLNSESQLEEFYGKS